MKTKILTFFLTLIVLNTNAQVLKSIGLKGGATIANQKYEFKSPYDKFEFDNKLGLYTALSAEFFNFKFISLVTDFAYQQKGMQLEIPETTNQEPDGTGEFYTLRNTHTYMSVSPMMKGFYSINKFSGYVLIGPRIDYQLSMDAEFLPDLFEASEKIVFGLNYGIGLAYQLNKINLTLEYLAQPDFTALRDEPPMSNNTGYRVTNNSYVINMGINYRLNRN